MIKSSYCLLLGFFEILVVTYFYPLLDENAILETELLELTPHLFRTLQHAWVIGTFQIGPRSPVHRARGPAVNCNSG